MTNIEDKAFASIRVNGKIYGCEIYKIGLDHVDINISKREAERIVSMLSEFLRV